MKKIFTTILLALVAMTTWAYDVEVDGIYYNLNSTVKTAEVTYKTTVSPGSYSGTVVIPETVVFGNVTYSITSIGYNAFYGCTDLTSVTIPNSVASIGNSAFPCCYKLTSMTIPESVKSIGSSAFQKCTGLKSIDIPNSVKSIGLCAFSGCTGLTSVIIPNSVTSIGNEAFYCCSNLTSVTIPNSVTSIGDYAYYGCENLETVTCYAEKVPSMDTDVFKDSYVSNATLKVPGASIDLYKAADQWKDFGTIIGIEGGTAEKCATPTIRLRDGKIVATSETERATCTVTKEVKTVDDGYTLVVTAYATADGYGQSETATAIFPLTIGESSDVNGDGKVTITDISTLADKLLKK